MQLFKQHPSNAWAAIRFTETNISVANVSRRNNAKPFVNVARVELGNLQDLPSIKAIANKHLSKKVRFTVILDFNDYQLLQVEKPNVPASELKQATSWKVKDLIDYSVDDATIDVIDIPIDPANAKRQQYVFAVCAKNQHIAEISNQLAEASLNLKAIDVRVMAQRNIAAMLEEENRGLAMLSFNHSGGLLTFTSGGELYHSRRIEIDSERNKTAFETISLELQRSLDHFDSQFPYITINKLILAPFELRDAFCEHLRNYINLPVSTFELHDIFEFDSHIELGDLNQQASLLPVLGAALREELTA
jgi:MSHA biogenesis protein MshI